jgi:pyruvate dehydrogenase (quinone)
MLAGEPKFEASQDIPDVPYSRFAELLGLRGSRIERPENIEALLRGALQADRQTVLDFMVDGNVPISLPHLIK